MAASTAAVLLQAVLYTTEADIGGLRKLVGSNSATLGTELVLRILLTYLPESTEPSEYTGLIIDLIDGSLSANDDTTAGSRPATQVNEEDAKTKAREIRLLSLESVGRNGLEGHEDLLVRFVLSRAHRIDAEIGSLLLVQQFVEPFVSRSMILQQWTATVLLPLIRLEYEYHPQESQIYTLSEFEGLEGRKGLMALLLEVWTRRDTTEPDALTRDLRGIIGPWVYGATIRASQTLQEPSEVQLQEEEAPVQGSARLWIQLDEWLLETSRENFATITATVCHWQGQGDIDFGDWLGSPDLDRDITTAHYTQTILAMMYLPLKSMHSSIWDQYSNLITQAVSKMEIDSPVDFRHVDVSSPGRIMDDGFLRSISAVHSNPSELLDPSNPLTQPKPEAVNLAYSTLASSYLLSTLGEELFPEGALSLALRGFEPDQRTRLQRVLHRLGSDPSKSDEDWKDARHKILWLRNWTVAGRDPGPLRQGVFCRISCDVVELEILKAIVAAGRFMLVKSIYLEESLPTSLSSDQVRKAVLEVALSFYDNASNGNKTRGGIKKASDIINAFRSHYPKSPEFTQSQSLIQATHSLSFYALTLQHGVPFLPVNIRVHSNPLSLIEKVLDQNARSYTKLDDLVDIGRDLVKAGLIHFTHDDGNLHNADADNASIVERRVVAMAISAALKEDDFDTAYSYIVNRLSPIESTEHNHLSEDTVLWQAAYQAGQYKPKNSNSSKELHRLEQRMELLSKALLIAPASSLQKVLATWRECEKETNTLLAQESEEEERWNEKGDRYLPGGFTGDDIVPTPHKPRDATRRAMDEEAPMGLFEVARGAASAFSKSAFPLRGQTSKASTSRGVRPTMTPEHGDDDDQEGGERARKRDMVSNMVTGGLKSGIGWVIGARSSDVQD